LQRDPLVQSEGFRRWRRRWLVESPRRCSHQSMPLGRGGHSQPPAAQRELADVVSKPQVGQARACADDRHIMVPAARGPNGLLLPARNRKPAGAGGSLAKRGRPLFYWRG